jgi:allantoinase
MTTEGEMRRNSLILLGYASIVATPPLAIYHIHGSVCGEKSSILDRRGGGTQITNLESQRDNQNMAHAFISKRIVTPLGTREGALLVDGEKIQAICRPTEVPADATIVDCGNSALLPGLVDTHVHINQPGRTEWEGFRTATRAAAAGGYTTLVDMPLNCLPETTTVAALEEKRQSAQGECFVDWAPWGGAVADNQSHILPLARAGVLGFKCFLIYPGCDGFTMIDQQQLEAALPFIAESKLPLLVHAELAEPIDAAMQGLTNADWRSYTT